MQLWPTGLDNIRFTGIICRNWKEYSGASYFEEVFCFINLLINNNGDSDKAYGRDLCWSGPSIGMDFKAIFGDMEIYHDVVRECEN